MARLSVLIAALAALAVAPVQAASFASASLTDFKITLFDLNPADGIKPGITFPDLPRRRPCFRRCSKTTANTRCNLRLRYRAVRSERG